MPTSTNAFIAGATVFDDGNDDGTRSRNAFGYQDGVGTGGAVTQLTSKATGVTINKLTGTITTDNASLGALAAVVFTVTNDKVTATDSIELTVVSGRTTAQTIVYEDAVTAGSFDIIIHNQHASTEEIGALVINFSIKRGAND